MLIAAARLHHSKGLLFDRSSRGSKPAWHQVQGSSPSTWRKGEIWDVRPCSSWSVALLTDLHGESWETMRSCQHVLGCLFVYSYILYRGSGLNKYLDKQGFSLVGYGCTTCIGNSGDVHEAVAEAIAANGASALDSFLCWRGSLRVVLEL